MRVSRTSKGSLWGEGRELAGHRQTSGVHADLRRCLFYESGDLADLRRCLYFDSGDHLLANRLLEVAKKNAVKPEGQWLSPEPSDAQPSSSQLGKAWKPDGFTIFF